MTEEMKIPFAEWSVVELLGHRRLGAYVTEQEIAGKGFLRLDIPGDGDAFIATQLVNPTSVYALTPVSEAMARAVARHNQPQPVQRWELPPAPDERTLVDAPDLYEMDAAIAYGDDDDD